MPSHKDIQSVMWKGLHGEELSPLEVNQQGTKSFQHLCERTWKQFSSLNQVLRWLQSQQKA